ncbi:rRNA cytosine-C5-methylase [uncultured Alistipes sp.]|nr:rRNA cytosine-C5-methylase [uncultured Alistipes sp.]
MRPLPEAFVARIAAQLGAEEGRALCAALDGVPPVSVRLHPVKGAAGTLAALAAAAEPEGGAEERAGRGPKASPQEERACAEAVAGPHACGSAGRALPGAQRVPWSAEGYYLSVRPQFTLDPDFHAGAYYVQEAGSQFVGHLLAGEELAGRRLLDLCAAPGGKTTIYASLVGGDGLVVANEIDRRRAQVLADNVRKWGTGNVAVTTCEPQRLGDFEAWFDVVAADAPCSGEGMFRKDDEARDAWSEGGVRMCAARQAGILAEAWRALRPGGLLLYSTCTFNRTEDEEVLEAFAEAAGADAVETAEVPVDPAWGIVCGRAGVFRTYRFFPHRARGEGFFAAVARKSPDAGGRPRRPRSRREVLTAPTRDEVRELSRWLHDAERMRFFRAGDRFYACAAAQEEALHALAGALPVICSGVEMGQIFKGTLRPAHALALSTSLDRGAVATAELAHDEALDYLRRRDVAAHRFAEGMNLVCCGGRPLGWAKRIGSRVNNLYPESLRIWMNVSDKPSAEPNAVRVMPKRENDGKKAN